MIKLIKNNKAFLSIYILFLVSIIVLLTVYGKREAQLTANQFYNSFFDEFFFWSTKTVEWFSFAVILFILCFKGAKYAINGLLIYGLTALITFTLKRQIFVDALRPTKGIPELRRLPAEFNLHQLTNHSFPSGHTTASFALFCFLALISKRKYMGYIYGVIAAIVGYSRIYLSQHYFEDILTGATIGTFATIIFYYYLDKIPYKKWALKPLIKLRK